VPAAVVHYCYRSVEDLIDAVMRAVFGESAEVAAVALRANGSVEQSLRTAVHRLWSNFRADPARHKAIFDLISYSMRRSTATEIVQGYQIRVAALAERFLADLAAHNKSTWDTPEAVLGRALMSTVDGVLWNWLIDRNDSRTEQALMWLAVSIAAQAS
jgi:AcrR family transcriptional regulator